eukprot:6760348-Pyramimonas_sp.AAC.1
MHACVRGRYDAALKHSLTAEGDFLRALEKGMPGNKVVWCAPGGYMVDVKGYTVDAKGYIVDVKGSVVDDLVLLVCGYTLTELTCAHKFRLKLLLSREESRERGDMVTLAGARTTVGRWAGW